MNGSAGQRASVTATGQGTGFAVAEAYGADGAEVTATDHDGARRNTFTVAETQELDVTNKAAMQEAVATAAADILVNRAGFVRSGSILDATDDASDVAMHLNAGAMIHTIQAMLRGMRERGADGVVNISSVASSILAAPSRSVCGPSKGAVIGLTKSVAVDSVSQDICAHAICPGTVDAPRFMSVFAPPATKRRRSRPSSPVPRWGGSFVPTRSRRAGSALAPTRPGS